MGTLNEKLEYLSQTKEYIKEAIISKGQPVSSSDTFRSYASKISAIDTVNNEDPITVNPTTSSQTVTPDQNHTGLSSVTVSGVTSAIDANIQAGNIKKDVQILGVTGTLEDIPAVVESLSITPTTSAQSFTPTSGVDGYAPVTVSAVDSSIDANITAGNIKSGVEILGVEGTYAGESPNLQSKIARQNGVVTADSGYDGLSSVDIGVGQIGDTYEAVNKSGNNLNANDKVWLTYRQSTPDTSESLTGKEWTVFNYSNDDLLYLPSSSSNLYNLLTKTYTTVASSAYPQTIWYEDGKTYLQGTATKNIHFEADGSVETDWTSDGTYESQLSFINGRVRIWANSGSGYPHLYIDETHVAEGSYMIYYMSRGGSFCWEYNNKVYLITNCNFDKGQDGLALYVLDLDNKTFTRKSRISSPEATYEGNCYGLTSDKKYVIYSNYEKSAFVKINYSNDTISDATGSCGISLSVNYFSFYNPVGKYLVVQPTSITNAKDCILYKYNETNEVFDQQTDFKFPDTTISPSNKSVAINNTASVVTIYRYDNSSYTQYLDIFKYATNGGWVIVPYDTTVQDSLTGYAKSAISAGATGSVIVGTLIKPTLESLTVTPTTSAQTITPGTGVDGYDEVLVSAVTSAIDPDITPENIVEGINILGVTGTAEITTLDVTTPRLVVINNGTDGVAYSDNGGNTWSESEMPVTAEWRSIAFGNGRYVAVAEGSSNTVGAYSDDGINWTQTTMPSGNWYGICYGAGKFVSISYNSNSLAYSIDGINWTSITLTNSDNWNSMTYGNGAFVIVGKNYYAYSTDGITWVEDNLPLSNVTAYTQAGDNISVTILQNNTAFAYSEDITQGFSAGFLASDLKQNWYNLCYGGGTFLATVLGALEGGYITMISSNGTTWTKTVTTTSFLGEAGDHSYDLKTVRYDESIGKFVGLTRNGEYTFTAGTDGIWTVVENDPVLTGNSWNGMCYGEPVTGITTVDAMLNMINGENIPNHDELDDALHDLNGESA